METNQFKGVPVNSPGLLSLIKKMDSQPLFQDTAYLFKNSYINIRIPLDKEECGKRGIPVIDKPWLGARVIDKLNHDNCYVLEVLGHQGKVVSTTVVNLEQNTAWMIKLDVIHQEGARSLHMECANHPLNDLEDYPLVIFGEYKDDTIALYGGLDSMPANHLLEEIAALFPLPPGTPTNKPMIIYAAMGEDQPPEIPRKSKRGRLKRNQKPSDLP